MKRGTRFLLTALLIFAALVTLVVWWRPVAHRSVVLTDVAHPVSLGVHAPLVHSYGGLFVIVEGHLDGDAELDITSNHGRDQRRMLLHGTAIEAAEGGAEEWGEDLQVSYHPGTAKTGQLYIAIYCGEGLTREDNERSKRILSHRR